MLLRVKFARDYSVEKNPCRRCNCGSTLVPVSNHYYYGDYHKLTKYPWPRRNINEDLQGLQAIEDGKVKENGSSRNG